VGRVVVLVLDVGGDHFPGLVDGFELVAPDAAFLEVAEPGLDECLALGVALAAAAVSDPSPGSTSWWRSEPQLISLLRIGPLPTERLLGLGEAES
jgi:hypothetical protein